MSRILDATDPDLGAFLARGGKLLLYHGWADTGVNPMTTVRYYERVREKMGADTESFARLFMVPGMFHCRGGLNVDRFDGVAALIAWVERGEAPAQLIASRVEDGRVVRTRRLCPYPAVARYVAAAAPMRQRISPARHRRGDGYRPAFLWLAGRHGLRSSVRP
jgi:feruloyl esterase